MNGKPVIRRITPSNIQLQRRRSTSVRLTSEYSDEKMMFLPKIPDQLPDSPRASLRQRRASTCQEIPVCLTSIPADVTQLIQSLEKQDYSKLDCRISLQETIRSLTTDTFTNTDHEPAKMFMEKRTPMSIAQEIYDDLCDIENSWPDHFKFNTIQDMDSTRHEMAVWLHALRECANQVAFQSRGLALVLSHVAEHIQSMYKMALNQVNIEPEEDEEVVILGNTAFGQIEDFEFKNDFVNLEFAIQNSNVSSHDKELLYKSLHNIERTLVQKIHEDKNTKEMERTIKELKEQNNKLVCDNFDVQSRRNVDDNRISDLMNVNDILRQKVRAHEQKIYQLTHCSSSAAPVIQGIGGVPSEVLESWNQISHFCESILRGDLSKIKFDAYFPKEVVPGMKIPEFKMRKPRSDFEKQMHFMSFFNMIKKGYNHETVFTDLENRIREFITQLSELYCNNFLLYKKKQDAVMSSLSKKLDYMRGATSDSSVILKSCVIHKDFLQVPKKAGKPEEVMAQISNVYSHVSAHGVEKSVTNTIIDSFGGCNNPDIVPFIAQICKLSKTNFDVDMFKRFLMGELPRHHFIFFSEISSSDSPKLVRQYFDAFGWNSIPKVDQVSLDSKYGQQHPRLLCLALYDHCISAIEKIIKETGEKDVEYEASKILRVTGPELTRVAEEMKTVADDGKISPQTLAVVLFRRKVPLYSNILADFRPDESSILYSYNFFGMKPKGKGKKKGETKLSSQPSVILPTLNVV